MVAAEEMAAGADLQEGVHGQRVVVHHHAGEVGMQGAAEIRIHDEFFIGHGQQAIEEAGGMQDEVGAAMHRRQHRHQPFLHRLAVRQLGVGKIAGAAQRQLQPAGELADYHRADRRLRRAEGRRAGAQRHGGQEITEGLAAYTATVLVADSDSDAIGSALDLLVHTERIAKDASFVRTFAYFSGPAYGLLLDASSPDWRKRIKNTDDLAVLLMQALNIKPGRKASIAAARYDGAEILLSEQKREEDRQARLNELRKTFVEGPTLSFPGGNHSYDTRGAVSLQGIGTIYFGPFRASGAWGKLEAEKGVLVSSDGSFRRVAAPIKSDETTFSGDGWKLYLSPGWIVKEGERKGSFEVVKE